MAFITHRMSSSIGRPAPQCAIGSNGRITSHCASLKSLAYPSFLCNTCFTPVWHFGLGGSSPNCTDRELFLPYFQIASKVGRCFGIFPVLLQCFFQLIEMIHQRFKLWF